MLLLRQSLRVDHCMLSPLRLFVFIAVLYMRNALFSTLIPYNRELVLPENRASLQRSQCGLVCRLSPDAWSRSDDRRRRTLAAATDLQGHARCEA